MMLMMIVAKWWWSWWLVVRERLLEGSCWLSYLKLVPSLANTLYLILSASSSSPLSSYTSYPLYLKHCIPHIISVVLIVVILTTISIIIPRIKVAELGSLSSGAKMAMKIFVKRVFIIWPKKALFLPKDLRKVRKSRQILICDKIAYVRA